MDCFAAQGQHVDIGEPPSDVAAVETLSRQFDGPLSWVFVVGVSVNGGIPHSWAN